MLHLNVLQPDDLLRDQDWEAFIGTTCADTLKLLDSKGDMMREMRHKVPGALATATAIPLFTPSTSTPGTRASIVRDVKQAQKFPLRSWLCFAKQLVTV